MVLLWHLLTGLVTISIIIYILIIMDSNKHYEKKQFFIYLVIFKSICVLF